MALESDFDFAQHYYNLASQYRAMVLMSKTEREAQEASRKERQCLEKAKSYEERARRNAKNGVH